MAIYLTIIHNASYICARSVLRIKPWDPGTISYGFKIMEHTQIVTHFMSSYLCEKKSPLKFSFKIQFKYIIS